MSYPFPWGLQIGVPAPRFPRLLVCSRRCNMDYYFNTSIQIRLSYKLTYAGVQQSFFQTLWNSLFHCPLFYQRCPLLPSDPLYEALNYSWLMQQRCKYEVSDELHFQLHLFNYHIEEDRTKNSNNFINVHVNLRKFTINSKELENKSENFSF